jgi:hypothetical protein
LGKFPKAPIKQGKVFPIMVVSERNKNEEERMNVLILVQG